MIISVVQKNHAAGIVQVLEAILRKICSTQINAD